jgi:hypothetical protein
MKIIKSKGGCGKAPKLSVKQRLTWSPWASMGVDTAKNREAIPSRAYISETW